MQKLRKLRKMSVAEMACRIGEVRRRSQERRLWKNGRANRLQQELACVAPQALILACHRLVIGAQPDQIEQLRSQYPDQYRILADSAKQISQQVLSGQWTMLGHDYDLRGDIDWHQNHKTGFSWSREFYGDLSISQPGQDVKYVWEISRHQYLVDLSRGWLLANDEVAATTVQQHLSSWMAENPLYEGINWTSALEVAMRAISWSWVVSAMGDRLDQGADVLQKMINSLADHAVYLQHHLSFYSSPYNHLMGEATGLYLVGFLLQDHPQSAEWRKLARSVLTAHTARQFYADGITVEQAIGYHYYTLGFLSLSIAIARLEDSPLQVVEKSVYQAYLVGATLRQPDGRWPNIGDLDSARSLPVHHQDYWRFGSLCSLGAALFGDANLVIDDAPGDELYWLQGVKGVARWEELDSSRSRNSDTKRLSTGDSRQHILKDSGYVVTSSKNDWLLFDAGPIAGGLFEDSTSSVAHGHADTLQVLYWMDGKNVLSDCGIQSYADRESADYFRSPAAHNTLEVAGFPIAKNAGKLAWSYVTKRPHLDVRLGDDAWLAHGRVQFAEQVSVDRYLLGIPGAGLWITDLIQTDTPREVSWYWQLGEKQLQTSHYAQSLYFHDSDGVSCRIWATDAIADWKVEAATGAPPIGLQTTGYGVANLGQRLRVRLMCKRIRLMTTFVGRKKSPITLQRVEVAGQALDCANSVRGTENKRSTMPEIAWTLSEKNVTQEYLAGNISAAHLPSDARPLQGVGNWPVFRIQGAVTRSATTSDGSAVNQG